MQRQTAAMPSWAAPFAPQRCEVCGRAVMPDGMDVISQLNKMFSSPFTESLNRALAGMLPSALVSGRELARLRGCDCDCGCRCDDCARDTCHCRCCIGDADLVVYARVGELRIVPIVVENNRRRERQVRLELSGWTTSSGKPSGVTGQLQPPAEFTLPPCQERAVVLELNVKSADNVVGTPDNRLRDVDDCQVLYADLRVEGCAMRPIRIALAILPRDCAAYEIDCRCSCC